MIDYHKVTKNISINLLIFNKLRHSIALFFTQFKTASKNNHTNYDLSNAS